MDSSEGRDESRLTQAAHLEQAQAVANLGSWYLDLEADHLAWSDEVYAIFGIDPDEPMTYEKFLEHVHPDDRDYVDREWHAALSGEPYDIEHRIEVDGETRWVRERADLEFDADGEPTSGIGVVQDITERKRRERQLEELKAEYETLSEDVFDQLASAIVVLDADFHVVWLNAAAADYLGLDREAAIGADKRELIQSTIANRFAEPDRFAETVLATYDDNTYTERFEGHVVADDQDRWLEHWSQPIKTGLYTGGRVELYADITERKRREQSLRRVSRAVEASGHAVYITDPDGTILQVNPAFERITGYSADEAVGENPRILKSGAMGEDYYAELWETVLDGEVWEEVVINERKGGDRYHAHQTIAPVTDDAGEIEAFVAIQTDITERVELEDDLRESLQQIRVLDRVLRHNLHNEMNVIRGYASTLEDALEGSELADHAEQIVTTSDRLLDTVDKEREITELLSDARAPGPTELVPIVTSVVEAARERYPEAEIAIDAPDELPAIAIPAFERAVEELVTNAVVHSDRDHPVVEVSLGRTDGRVRLAVTDDGPGIPEAEQQVLGTDTETAIEPLFHGSGLGLWLVHLIVRESGGELAFSANEPRGSVVTVTLEAA